MAHPGVNDDNHLGWWVAAWLLLLALLLVLVRMFYGHVPDP